MVGSWGWTVSLGFRAGFRADSGFHCFGFFSVSGVLKSFSIPLAPTGARVEVEND